MENLNEAFKELKIQIENQNREIKSFNSKLKNAMGKPLENHRELPRYQNNATKYSQNPKGQYCIEKYSYQETIYFPKIGNNFDARRNCQYEKDKQNYFNRKRYSQQKHVPMYTPPNINEKYDFNTKIFQPDSYKKYNTNKERSHQKSKIITEAQLKLRQNHLPFLIDKAKTLQSCRACHQYIKKDTIIIIHKEIKAYADYYCGWDKPRYSKFPIHQFYHFDKRCLNSRGFEDIYLSLCYIEVTDSIGENEIVKIKELGFRRPLQNKIVKIQNEKDVENLKFQGIGNKFQNLENEEVKNLEMKVVKDIKIEDFKMKNEADKSQMNDLHNSVSKIFGDLSDDEFVECVIQSSAINDEENLEFDFCE